MILPAAVLALPWRLIGAVGLVAVVALMGWRVTRWHDAYAALPGLRDALAREEACEEGSQCADRVAALTARHDAIAQEVAADYARELADIAARPVPVQPVRLCRPRGAGGVPNGTAPAPLMAPPPAESFRSKLQAILDSAYSTSPIKPTAKH